MGAVLSFGAAFMLNSFPVRRATIVVSALVCAAVGFARGAETGDMFGMFLHGGYQVTSLEVSANIYMPRAPNGTYRPRHLAYILGGLLLLAIALAWK